MALDEPDPLRRVLLVEALAAIGCVPASDRSAASHAATAFLPLGADAQCPRLRERGRGPAPPAARRLVVGYGTKPDAVLAAHRAHGCVDVVLRLAVSEGRPAFRHVPSGGAVDRAGLSAREADVLLLLLAGATTAEIAGRLVVSAATARTHCRAVLRKLGAADRRTLRARLLAGLSAPGPEVCAAHPPSLPRNRP